MPLTILIHQKEIDYNGGYASPAESCKKLILHKDGVTLELDGKELAQLYNAIRPAGTAPKMDIPWGVYKNLDFSH